jgi:hypothetical protein
MRKAHVLATLTLGLSLALAPSAASACWYDDDCPSDEPTDCPTEEPTDEPTDEPTVEPTTEVGGGGEIAAPPATAVVGRPSFTG